MAESELPALLQDGHVYYIRNQASMLNLTLTEGPDRPTNGAVITVTTPLVKGTDGCYNQMWKLEWYKGSWIIVCVESGTCLDLDCARSSNGTKVQGWKNIKSGGQLWQIDHFREEWFCIKNALSGTVLDVDCGEKRINGSRVQGWQQLLNENQSWRLEPVPVKRALLLHYNSGTDESLFYVKDKLERKFNFHPSNITTLCFAPKPENQSHYEGCPPGCRPPTVKNFQVEFKRMLTSAFPGDVCFVYVDCHGAHDDRKVLKKQEADGRDEFWRMAEDDSGKRDDLLQDDWVANTIRAANLHPSVNLTILTSSCRGGGMLDTSVGSDDSDWTPGILLAACAENQTNVKGGDTGIDRWTSAIFRKAFDTRGLPHTYQELFENAKDCIKNVFMKDPQFDDYRYRGPSPVGETPRGMWSERRRKQNGHYETVKVSYQDPQMVYHPNYLKENQARFLEPLPA